MKMIGFDGVAWIVSAVFVAGGGWDSLQSMDDRVSKLEDKQEEVAKDIRQIMVNQHSICVAVDAECVR